MLSARIVRCGNCWREVPYDDITEEDGKELCPECVDILTAEYKGRVEAEEHEYAASRTLRPQVSRTSLNEAFSPTVRALTDDTGARVLQSAPLRMKRNVAKTLILSGREFSSADTITASTGITVTVTSRTLSQTTLSLTPSVSMAPGDSYSLIFNGSIWHNVLSVR